MKKAVCIISGGMDSTLCAYIAKDMGYEIIGLHFDYNQRTMQKERECFLQTCKDLNIKKYQILNLGFIANIGGNALTDKDLQIPKDEIDKENKLSKRNEKNKDVPITYVPFRNGIFLSIAAALAEKEGCEAIFIGVVEEDSSGYPDCTNDFIKSMQNSLNLGTATKNKIEIITPLVKLSKADIVKKSLELGVKLEHTWSCYERQDKACGHCDSCLLRLRGFKMANQKDRIEYLD